MGVTYCVITVQDLIFGTKLVEHTSSFAFYLCICSEKKNWESRN